MIKVSTSLRLASRFSQGLSWRLSRKLYSQGAMKSNSQFHSRKWDDDLTKKAAKLFFCERKYHDFTPEEKGIVDFVQERMLEVDGGVIMPNTRADLEQREIEQLIKQRQQNQ